jgi:hypothetical protein
LRLGALPAVGRLCESKFFFLTKARSQPAVGRHKEIGENLSDLPEAGRLFVHLFFIWRAKTPSRKENPFASSRLCALTSFFSRQEGKPCLQ